MFLGSGTTAFGTGATDAQCANPVIRISGERGELYANGSFNLGSSVNVSQPLQICLTYPANGFSWGNFKYSSSGDPESSGTTKSASGSSAGDFSASLTGLNSNTTYYVRAYVKNSLGYEYGELKTFTTGDSGVIF